MNLLVTGGNVIAASSILLLGLMIFASRPRIIWLQIGSSSGTNPNPIVSTRAENGTLMAAYWVVVENSSGSTVQTGFSTAQFTLPAGNYLVGVEDYGGEYFAHWGETEPLRDYIRFLFRKLEMSC